RVDFDSIARTALADYDVLRVGFLEPHGFELLVTPAKGKEPVRWQLRREGLVIDAPEVEVGIDQIVEVSIPFTRLGVRVDQPVQFHVELLQDRQSRDRAPREGTISLTCPSPDFEQIMWD